MRILITGRIEDGEFEPLFGLSAVLMAVWRYGVAVVP